MGANNLVLIGGGGHCHSVIDVVHRLNLFDEVVITDCLIPPETCIMGCKVVGTDDKLLELRSKGFLYAFITVGSIESTLLRRKLEKKAEELDFIFPTIIDPSAVIAHSATILEGGFVGKQAVVNSNTELGKHCIVNTGAIIEHDCKVGDFSHISSCATLCGQVNVGSDTHIGAGSVVRQEISIGHNCIIGVGSAVVKDIPDNAKAYGNPCRVVK